MTMRSVNFHRTRRPASLAELVVWAELSPDAIRQVAQSMCTHALTGRTCTSAPRADGRYATTIACTRCGAVLDTIVSDSDVQARLTELTNQRDPEVPF